MDPMTIAAIAGTVGGFLKKGPKVPRNVQHIQRMQMLAMKGLSDFANSAPMTDPLERMALAQSRGLLGQEQMGQQQQLFSAFNPMTDQGNVADLMRNLTTEQIGQRMNLDNQALFEALNARRQAMGQVTGMGAQALPAAAYQGQQTGPDLGSIFGNLANIYAQSRTRQASTQNTGTTILNPIASSSDPTKAWNSQVQTQNPTGGLGSFR